MKRALLLLLMAIFMPWAANAQSVQIGDGTTTFGYLPAYSLYNYSVTQQIYTADEIAASGTITSIAFYNGGTTKERQLSIYMMHTSKAVFESTTDWVAVTDANLVYAASAPESITAGEWTTFTLTTPFAYNGTDNLLVAVIDLTGSWESGMACRVFTTTTNQAIYKYQDAGAYGPDGTYNGDVQTGYLTTNKNQIILGGIQQAYPNPSNLVVTPYPTSAKLEWTENGTATSWEVAYKLASATDYTTVTVNTNPYTITGLTGETAYNAKVRAYYSASIQSGWTSEATFTTLVACPAPTALAASNLTTTTATLGWTAGYEETNWVLQYGTTNAFSDGTYTEVTVTGTPTKDLTGLTEATTYYARVKASCGGGDESAWSTTYTFATKETCPDGMICIGEGTSTSTYLPADNYYKYGLTQQIYTAEEIGQAGEILSIDFYKAQDYEMVKSLDIYMVSTTKSEFASATDWITVTAADLVFTGNVTFDYDTWTTITLDTPFNYDGTSNLAIIIDNNTGSYVSSTNFRVFSTGTTYQAMYTRSDGSNADPTAPSGTGNRLTVKNRIRLVMGEPPACPRPSGLTVNYESGTTATVTWSGDATSFNISVNGNVTNNVTSPYTLTNLELDTDYEVMVQANCGSNGLSEWTNPVTFTTDACLPEEMLIVNYELTDSYGDGWNSNYILLMGEDCEINSDYVLTIESGSSATGTIKLCNTSYLQFVWYLGSYPGETSWVFTDASGNVLFEGAGNTDMATGDVLYTIDNHPYVAPSEIEVSNVGPRSAVLSWKENGTATAWQIRLIEGTGSEAVETIIDANTNPFTLTGLEPETDYEATVRAVGSAGTSVWPCLDYVTFSTLELCPVPSNLVANHVTAETATLNWEGFGSEYNVRYGVRVHGSELENINFDDSSLGSWTTIDADGDGYDWVLGSLAGGIYLVDGGSLAGTGHESSADLVTSGSYSNYSGEALTPDNYLVSPQVELGGTITFWACGQDASYAAEHFGVAVSTSGNTNAADFTTIWERTMEAKSNGDGVRGGNAEMFVKGGAKANPGTTRSGNRDQGTWRQYTVDLSDYSGQGYVAIRHFNCTDMFMLDVDDIVIEGPATIIWNELNTSETSVDIDGLEAETEYIWQVQADCLEDGASPWSDLMTFTTTDYCTAPSDLEALNITSNGATLSWAGSQDDYELKYRATKDYYYTTFNEGATALKAEGWNWEGYIIYGMDDPILGIDGDDNYFLQMGWSTTNETYIFTPELPEYESGAIVEFYPIYNSVANTFQIGYSTTTNDTLAFTWSEPIAAGTTDYDLLYSEVLPDGVKYIAFKATAAAQSSCIFIDNFRIYTVIADWEEEEVRGETTFDLDGFDPNTIIEWMVRGVNEDCEGGSEDGYTEWSEMNTFTTLDIQAQTIDLVAGWNWVSFSKVITLADLKAALLAANPGARTIIKSKSNGQTMNTTGTNWTGALNALDLSQMYEIKVANACTIELKAETIDPADYPATIHSGANWIAYPLEVEMTVKNAFSGFAARTDQVKSKTDGVATFITPTNCNGALTTLKPGNGYIYISKATEDKPFTYPNPSK